MVCIFAVLKWLGCEVVSVEINVRQRGTKYFSFLFLFVIFSFVIWSYQIWWFHFLLSYFVEKDPDFFLDRQSSVVGLSYSSH